MISDYEVFVHINGIYGMLEAGMSQKPIKEIPPLIMVAIDKKNPEIQKMISNTNCDARCFRILQPDILNDQNQNDTFYRFGRRLKEENENVVAVFFAGMFFANDPDPDTGEIIEENKHECFVISSLTKDGRSTARIIPLDRDPDGFLILLNTKNQYVDKEYGCLKDFYRGYDSGYWSFSKLFGGN